MRLKKHREDVKIIRWQDIVGEEEAKDIARRYLNLIRAYEKEKIMFVANKKEECDFDVTINGETWHIESVWKNLSRLPAWYDGTCIKQGIKFSRIFSPDEIKEPEVTYAK